MKPIKSIAIALVVFKPGSKTQQSVIVVDENVKTL